MSDEPGRDEPESVTPTPSDDPAKQPGYTEDPADAADLGAAGGGAGQTLAPFLWVAFFLSLHRHAGEPEKHPKRAAVCFWMDFTLRAVAAVLLIAIAVITAWKALSPLPWTSSR